MSRFIFACVLLSSVQVQAGVINWCLHQLVQDDPYEFEQLPTNWLLKRRDELHVRIVWHKASARDLFQAERISTELERRRSLNDEAKED